MNAPTQDWIELSDQPIEAGRVRAHLERAPASERGGVCVFEGCTRGETHAEQGALARLDYEAYSDMALDQLHRLAVEARRQWPIGALAILHRTGAVAVGEPSVIIGVASSHRAEAFAACRWLIDALKRDVPIWKKEVWSSGATTWSDPPSDQPAEG